MDLFESRVDAVVRNGLERVLEASRQEWIRQVKKNWDFYNGNQVSYLSMYPGEQELEFKAKRKCPFNYTASVVDEYVAGVYQLPVTRTFQTDTNNEIMKRISENFQFTPFFRKVQKIAELSAMCGVIIRSDENNQRIFLEEISGEFVKIYPSKKHFDGVEHVIIAYNFDNDDPDDGLSFHIEGWSRERVIVCEVVKKEIRVVYDEPNTLRDENDEPFIPIVFFRPDEDPNSPYGSTNIDTTVEINHAYNGMWMDIMRTVQMQQFSLLFLKRPMNERQEAPKPVEIAPTRMLEDSHPDADAKYITPDPKINESLEALRRLRSELLDLSKVPAEVFSGGTKQGVESAQSLRIKKIPIEKVWKQRKASYGSDDRELGRKLILVAKNIWGVGDTTDLYPSIDYSESMQPMDIKEKIEKDSFDLQIGITNPYELYLAENPDIQGGIETAEKEVKNNLEITKSLIGVVPKPGGGASNPNETIEAFSARLKRFRQSCDIIRKDLKNVTPES
jgi:hypothetical protein